MEPKAAAKILETMTADIESWQDLIGHGPRKCRYLAEMDYVLAAKITKKMLDMDDGTGHTRRQLLVSANKNKNEQISVIKERRDKRW